MQKIIGLFKKYQSFILYAIFGVLTTCINIASYYMCFNVIGINNVISTIIAWIFAAAFAFVTNKIWVFDSRSKQIKVILYELAAFYICRMATGILDVAIMWLSVDIFNGNAMLWKMMSNIIVIVLNYIASKLVIFRKEK